MKTEMKKFSILHDNVNSDNNTSTGRTPLKLIKNKSEINVIQANEENLIITDKFKNKKTLSNLQIKEIREETKVKKTETCESGIQTENTDEITADDLTSSEPSKNYLTSLAEQRRVALEATLKENKDLWERIEQLEEQIKLKDKQLEEAKTLVSVLKEILDDD